MAAGMGLAALSFLLAAIVQHRIDISGAVNDGDDLFNSGGLSGNSTNTTGLGSDGSSSSSSLSHPGRTHGTTSDYDENDGYDEGEGGNGDGDNGGVGGRSKGVNVLWQVKMMSFPCC